MTKLGLGRCVLALAIAGLGGVLGVGCNDESDGSLCNSAISKLRSCKLIAANATFDCENPTSKEDVCIGRCYVNLSCEDLGTTVCTGGTADAFSTCTSKCRAQYAATCADGSTVPEAFKCDGYPDCSDGSDEVGCPVFRCADGSTVPADYKCDGDTDCDDGSDEVGCPVFSCADGSTVRADYKCDGEDDCDDGSDELSCPADGPQLEEILICGAYASSSTFTCADGTTVDAAWVCDGSADCADSSDETNC